MKKVLLGIFFALTLSCLCANPASAASLDNPMELPYVVEDGAEYYESSFGFGTGKHATVGESNPYTTEPCYAGINGYSYLDVNGYVIISDYVEDEVDIDIPEAPEGADQLFLHFRSTSFRNGWVFSEYVSKWEPATASTDTVTTPPQPSTPEETLPQNPHVTLPEEQNAVEIVEQIKAEVQNTTEKTAVIIDFSGSMDDDQRAVVDLLSTIEFTDDTTIIVFATSFETITAEQLENEDFSVGGMTFMLDPLNEAVSLDVDNMIIISDLYTNDLYDGVNLLASDKLKYVTVYDPDDYYDDDMVINLFKKTWTNAEVTRVRINNQ